MREDQAPTDLQSLDAVAAEQDGVLAFRVCEDSEEFEPVFMRFLAANPGASNETALISIDDRWGMSLGRFVVPRDRLDQALARVEDVEADDGPAVAPAEWESA